MKTQLFEWSKIYGTHLDHYEIEKDNSDMWENIGTNEFYEWVDIPNGEHTLKVKAINKVSQSSNILQWDFKVLDDIIIEKITPDPTELIEDTTYTLEWNLISGYLRNYVIQIDEDGIWGDISFNESYTFENLTNGVHNLKVKAFDMADNESNILDWSFEKGEAIVIEKVTTDFDYFSKNISKQISLGRNYTGTIDQNGKLWMWGRNNSGECDFPTGFNNANVRQVSLGYFHNSSIIDQDGKLWIWDNNLIDYFTIPTGFNNTNVKQISLGHYHVGVIDQNGKLWIWGIDDGTVGYDYGQVTGMPTDPEFINENIQQVSSGEWHSAAIDQNGKLWMWGKNDAGECTLPIDSEFINENIKQVSLGYEHSACIDQNGQLWMWGINASGQCTLPTDTGFINENIQQVSLGYDHSACIDQDGKLWVWGENSEGQCTLPTDPEFVNENIKQVALGYRFSACIDQDGKLWVWGRNDYGQTDIPPEFNGNKKFTWSLTEGDLSEYKIKLNDNEWITNNQDTSYIWESINNGLNTIKAKAINTIGNESNILEWSFEKIDNINIDKVTTIEDYTYNISETFEWSLTSGSLDHYEIQLDGNGWNTNDQLTTYTWDSLSVQSHTIEVKAVDIAGNENIISWTFEVIESIEINKTTTINDYTNNVSEIFEWELISGKLDHYEIQLDGGGWFSNNQDTTYTWDLLSVQSHTIEVKAVDVLGTESSIILWTFEKIDDISINKVSMTDDTYPWNKIFTWELASGSLDHYEISKDEGITWEVVGTNISYTWNDISDGTYSFIVKAIDIIDNEITIQWDFAVSVEPLVISKITEDFEYLIDGTNIEKNITIDNYTYDTSKTFEWSLSSGSLDHYEIQLDGGGWFSNNQDTTYTWNSMSINIHTIEVKAVDIVGAESTIISWTFEVIDNIELNKITTDFGYTNNVSETFEWELISGKLDHYEIQLDGGGWFTNNQNTSYTWDSISIQSHTIEVKAIDILGDEYIMSWAFERTDNIAITSNTTVDATTKNISQTFNWTLNSGSLDHYMIQKNDGSWISNGTSNSYTWDNLPTGTCTFKVYAVDVLENISNTLSWTFEKNENLVISKVNDFTIAYGSEVTIQFQIDSGTSDSFSSKVDSGTWESVGGAGVTSWTTNYSIGSHTVSIKAFDSYGDESNILTWSFDVLEDTRVVSMSGGSEHSLMLNSDYKLLTAGNSADGRLGRTGDTHIFIQINNNNWSKIASGYHHSVAIDANNKLWTWGSNWNSALGRTGDNTIPGQVNTSDWKNVAAGFQYTMAIKSDNTLWGCGHNTFGPLGLGHTSTTSTLTQVNSNSWKSVSCSAGHTLAIKSDNTLWSCGDNEYGKLGRSSPLNTYDHTLGQVGTSTWLIINAANTWSVGIKSDNTLWTWGHNNYGQLGRNGTTDDPNPTQVDSNNWIDIASGLYHTLAIKSDGTLWGFGRNNFYQLGLGESDTTNKSSPVQIGTDNDWIAVFAGGNFSLAVKSDNTVWGFGLDGYYALGFGDTTFSSVPRRI